MLTLQSLYLLAAVATFHLIQVDGSLFGCAITNSPACSRDSGKLRGYYDGIDSFLRESKTREDVNETMSMIEDWIKRESSQQLNQIEPMRLQALIQLHSLVQTDGPGRCTLSSSRILQNNDLSLRGTISKLTPGEIPKRRVERLVNYYASKFERQCDHELMVKEVDPNYLSYVEAIISDYVGVRAWDESMFAMFQTKTLNPVTLVAEQPGAASNYAKNMKGIRPMRDAALIHKWLLKLGQKNFDTLVQFLSKVKPAWSDEPTVDSNKLFKIFRKYLGKPCEQFIEKVEGSFGSTWAIAQSKKFHKRLDTEGPFYRNLTYFYGCTLILNNEEKLLEALRAFIMEYK